MAGIIFPWLALAAGLVVGVGAVGLAGRVASAQGSAATDGQAPDVPTGAPTEPAAPELRVLYYGPVGRVDALSAIDVVFSEPVAAREDADRTVRSGPLQLEPTIPGRFQWVGASALRFLPASPIAPGTRVQCRIEANTRARGGDALGEAITWEIDVAPPRLLSSWPPVTRARPEDPGAGPLFWNLDAGARPSIFDPWHDPVVLVFDRVPDPAAWRRLRLNGPEGEIALVEAPLDPQLWRVIGSDADPAHAIVVRSREPLQPGSSYQLAVPDDLPFPGCELTLDSPITIEISTPNDPRILGARASAEGIFLYPTNPIDPDSLSARLQLTPDPGDWTVHTPWRGATARLESEEANAIWIEGSFPAGESVEVRVLPGLRDAFGLAAMRPFVFQVQLPHRDAALTLAPSSGALLAGGAEYLRLTARNVGPVRVRAAWIRSTEMPIAYSNAASQALAHQPATLPWKDRWDLDETWDPGIADDEAHVHDLRLGEIPNPPRDVQALWVEAIAEPVYGRGSARDSLRATARVELATIGLSCALGERHGLLWATDLSSGQPLARADIALHKKVEPEDAVPAALDPVWNGKTDEDGLVWIPGSV
ncbi:MAG: hypothetical protein R3E12_20535, partial [Candidatus Eisenbacteria bacterium]